MLYVLCMICLYIIIIMLVRVYMCTCMSMYLIYIIFITTLRAGTVWHNSIKYDGNIGNIGPLATWLCSLAGRFIITRYADSLIPRVTFDWSTSNMSSFVPFCTTSDMNIFSNKQCLAACQIACTGYSDRFAARSNLQSFARSRSTAIDGDRGSIPNIDHYSTGTLCFVFNVLC